MSEGSRAHSMSVPVARCGSASAVARVEQPAWTVAELAAATGRSSTPGDQLLRPRPVPSEPGGPTIQSASSCRRPRTRSRASVTARRAASLGGVRGNLTPLTSTACGSRSVTSRDAVPEARLTGSSEGTCVTLSAPMCGRPSQPASSWLARRSIQAARSRFRRDRRA
jgi:hypothetical protein